MDSEAGRVLPVQLLRKLRDRVAGRPLQLQRLVSDRDHARRVCSGRGEHASVYDMLHTSVGDGVEERGDRGLSAGRLRVSERVLVAGGIVRRSGRLAVQQVGDGGVLRGTGGAARYRDGSDGDAERGEPQLDMRASGQGGEREQPLAVQHDAEVLERGVRVAHGGVFRVRLSPAVPRGDREGDGGHVCREQGREASGGAVQVCQQGAGERGGVVGQQGGGERLQLEPVRGWAALELHAEPLQHA
mmetsp:Transcript_20078/g.66797  ORF Transcript_20078/g.66797 Transcript_20078/m.66797 type:complete len:244 (-) Transcript_20078:233-964(-)